MFRSSILKIHSLIFMFKKESGADAGFPGIANLLRVSGKAGQPVPGEVG